MAVFPLLGAGLIAFLYADVKAIQKHCLINSCTPRPFLALQLNLHLFWLSPTSSTCLIWKLPCFKVGWGICIACKGTGWLLTRSHSCQMKTASSLSSCFRWMAVLTDRWNKLARRSRRDKLTFHPPFCSCSYRFKVYFYSDSAGRW